MHVHTVTYTCMHTHTGTPHTNSAFLCHSGCISIDCGSSLDPGILLHRISDSRRPSLATLPSFEEEMPAPRVSPVPTAINSTQRTLRHLPVKRPAHPPPSIINRQNICFLTICPSERDTEIKLTSFPITLTLARCPMSGKYLLKFAFVLLLKLLQRLP